MLDMNSVMVSVYALWSTFPYALLLYIYMYIYLPSYFLGS